MASTANTMDKNGPTQASFPGGGKAMIGVCQMTSTSVKSDNMQTIADLVASAKAKGSQVILSTYNLVLHFQFF